MGAGSTLLLLARNKDDLEVTEGKLFTMETCSQVTKEIVRDVRPGLAVEVQSLDLSTADKDAFERAVKGHQGSGDHEVEDCIVLIQRLIFSQRLQLSSTTLAPLGKMVAR